MAWDCPCRFLGRKKTDKRNHKESDSCPSIKSHLSSLTFLGGSRSYPLGNFFPCPGAPNVNNSPRPRCSRMAWCAFGTLGPRAEVPKGCRPRARCRAKQGPLPGAISPVADRSLDFCCGLDCWASEPLVFISPPACYFYKVQFHQAKSGLCTAS